ncbi:MAG: protein kinase [Thiotrichales bacterium]|nr:protein kinase [Thiotrichales bacterium]
MSRTVLIIDDSRDFRSLLRLFLNKEFTDVDIEEYDLDAHGRPRDEFSWSNYDVLLLDYKLGPDEDGLEWLKTLSKKPGFPPTVFLTAEGDEYTAVKAIKLGASDYLNKKDITPKTLAEAINEAIEYTPVKQQQEQEAIQDATQIVEDIQTRIRDVHTLTAPKREEDIVPPQRLEIGYKFVRQIGQGAMSTVYLAERIEDRQTVVLKVLDLTKVIDPSLIERFRLEAELIAEVNSPFVVKIYDHGITDEYGFIAMEFFSRGDLKQRMEMGLTPEVAINYLTHIAYGLDAIHKTNVIHRDLKPANIMFRGDDSLALADFGISKRLNDSNDLTAAGQILGTPHYMSPEQGEGEEIDARADLYSVGVLFYEFLTRKKPFFAETPSALIYQHVHADIPRLEGELEMYQPLLEKMLAKAPGDRFQSAAEMIQILEKAEQGIIEV